MEHHMEREKRFQIQEYVNVTVSRGHEKLCRDAYQIFGWEITEEENRMNGVLLKMQRDRNIENRAELAKLQWEFEEAIAGIEKLEHKKNELPTILSITVGLIGAVFMAGAVFAYVAGMYVLHLLLALPGIFCWVIPYFLFRSCSKKLEYKVQKGKEENYNLIYECMEKAKNLRLTKV